MAVRLEVETLTGVGRRAKYPWSDWTDSTVWRAVKGEDYDNVPSFKQLLRNYASTHDYWVNISETNSGFVDFQFSKRESQPMTEQEEFEALTEQASELVETEVRLFLANLNEQLEEMTGDAESAWMMTNGCMRDVGNEDTETLVARFISSVHGGLC
jgi:hypothetical protein